MSTKTKPQKKTKITSGIVWFEIPAEKTTRARDFYSAMFGWKIAAMPGMEDYWHIQTGGKDGAPDGALMSRMHSRHTITNYINVESITKATAKVKKLGGKICKSKTAVPTMGYFAICRDTEENEFALWEMNPKAK